MNDYGYGYGYTDLYTLEPRLMLESNSRGSNLARLVF